MIGQAVLYAASRATSNAVDAVTRRVIWSALGAIFLICALVMALALAFWAAEPYLGTLGAAGAVAGGCAVVGLLCLVMPTIIERIERMREDQGSAVANTMQAMDQEAKQAVDYFGAMQVVGAAFLFGLGAARRLKR